MSNDERPEPGTGLYRAEALRAMESRDDLERLLPVTSLRSWLVAVAGLLVAVAAVTFAASQTRTITIDGSGRVTDDFGIRLVTANISGQLASLDFEVGQQVEPGDVVAYVQAGVRLVPQRAADYGIMLGNLLRPGDPVHVGDWIAQAAPTESLGDQVLVTFDQEQGARLAVGQPATVTVTGSLKDPAGRTVTGRVVEVTDPMAAHTVELGLAIREPLAGEQILAAIELDAAVDPGSAVTVSVTVSERNLLQQLLGSAP